MFRSTAHFCQQLLLLRDLVADLLVCTPVSSQLSFSRTTEFFTISQQHKIGNIANIFFNIPLKIKKTKIVCFNCIFPTENPEAISLMEKIGFCTEMKAPDMFMFSRCKLPVEMSKVYSVLNGWSQFA